MNKQQLLRQLKILINEQDYVGGDYDSLYHGLKDLINQGSR